MSTVLTFDSKAVFDFYDLAKIKEHRYHSYDLCFNAFKIFLKKDECSNADYDYMALHLGMYLASWGMYRGSSKLLTDKSYQVHIGAVKILLQKEYHSLHQISPASFDSTNINLLISLFNELKKYYKSKGVSPTDTLITKIMLGTYACSVALDSRVKGNLGKLKITQKFGEKHLEDIKNYYLINKKIIDATVSSVGNKDYGIIKCLDMAFFD